MLNETAVYTAEFLLSEANGSISREEGVFAITVADVPAGTVLGKVTVGGAYAPYDNGASDGTQTAVAVLYSAVKANVATQPCVVIARHAEVDGAMLTGNDANGTTDLAAQAILVR